MLRLAWRLLGGVGLLAGALVLLLGAAIWASLPRLDGRVEIEGASAPVEILRDAWGVPRIRAASAEDAYLGLGYVHAQDRLWQMELRRRVAQGRLSEILGAGGLPTDRLMRTLGLYRRAEAAVAHLPDEARRYLESYARGVNAWLRRHRALLAPELLLLWHAPEPWTVADSLAFTRLMALDLGENWRTELLRARLARVVSAEQLADLFPPPDDRAPITIDPRQLAGLDLERLAAALPPAPPPGLGSNVWVVDGGRSASGQPLLANDPHLGLDLPGPWYLAGLEAPGLSVIGGTMPAMPIVVAGRNARLAWGLTNTGPDTQDLFVERLDPADPSRYLTPDGSAAFALRRETIAVRFGAPEQLLVRETRHGPVLSDLGDPSGLTASDRVLALAWTALDEDDVTLIAGFGLATAGSAQEVDAALAPFGSPQQNVVYATTGGDIGLVAPGRVPIRRAGDGAVPVEGADGRHDWIARIPYPELPRLARPPSGQIVNANNRLVGPEYPFLIARDWDPGLRARRIEAMLDGRSALTAEDFAAMQADRRSTLADDMLPFLLEAAAARATLPDLVEALGRWDRRMAPDRPEPLAFAAWYHELAATVYADELGPLLEAYRGQRAGFMRLALGRRQVWCDDVATAAVESCEQRIALAWQRATSRLRETYGADWRAWRWGKAHELVISHEPLGRLPVLGALFRISLERGGDGSTVDVAHYRAASDGTSFVSRSGPSYRMIVDLADPDGSLFIAPTGQSGHRLSPHWRDLTAIWSSGGYIPMRQSVAAAHRLVLAPAAGRRQP
jgi:penicillin amidase